MLYCEYGSYLADDKYAKSMVNRDIHSFGIARGDLPWAISKDAVGSGLDGLLRGILNVSL